MPKHRYKRRKKLIDKRFQIPVAVTLALAGLVMMVFHLVIVHYLAEQSRAGRVIDEPGYLYVVPMVLVLGIAYYWIGIVLSHRIVGPAYRLVQTMRDLEKGNFDIRARLRQGDGLKDVATELNELAEALSDRKRQHTELVAELRVAVDGGASDAEIRAVVGKLEGVWLSDEESVIEGQRAEED